MPYGSNRMPRPCLTRKKRVRVSCLAPGRESMVDTKLRRRRHVVFAPLKAHERSGERFQGYLLRVRGEFAKFHLWQEEQRLRRRAEALPAAQRIRV